MPMQGIDISSWNHPEDDRIDFNKVRESGVGFVMVKVTQGLTYVNPWAAEDLSSAHAAGLLCGAYHYAVPAADDAGSQAQYAAAAVHGLHLDLGISLDLEEQGTLQIHELGPWATVFLAEINRLGHQAPLYSNADYLQKMAGAPWGHKLWFASNDLPQFGGPYSIWIQQDPKSGTCPGVPGEVDRDTFYGKRGTNLVAAQPPAPINAATQPPESANAASHGEGGGTTVA